MAFVNFLQNIKKIILLIREYHYSTRNIKVTFSERNFQLTLIESSKGFLDKVLRIKILLSWIAEHLPICFRYLQWSLRIARNIQMNAIAF